MKAMVLDGVYDLSKNKYPLYPEVQVFDLEDANTAILEIKEGKIRGAKVLKVR